MLYRFVSSATFCVALLAEGVDRNMDSQKDVWGDFVALLAEGVDRNLSETKSVLRG